jgi:hypothetical protein
MPDIPLDRWQAEMASEANDDDDDDDEILHDKHQSIPDQAMETRRDSKY